ncbi:hypothetical protein J8273_8639 [Carpediemonas membranifera]|uniref:Uncharacterized protein n=1 Tax=Carpediemonas membranifera TaxID=201153 RepID=A0A8J6B4M8_9EUKA|nr:hypothetical protein J8273_8639 [Carpediemonas membranifera]|eukprot:KAG9389952.1 hypothetical protein J8273_8639 [Carpediemonas membranifera]
MRLLQILTVPSELLLLYSRYYLAFYMTLLVLISVWKLSELQYNLFRGLIDGIVMFSFIITDAVRLSLLRKFNRRRVTFLDFIPCLVLFVFAAADVLYLSVLQTYIVVYDYYLGFMWLLLAVITMPVCAAAFF